MKKGGILSGTLVLLVITLVAGLLLSAVHEWTREPIAQADRNAKAEAYRQVYAADAYTEIEDAADLLSRANAALASGEYDESEISYRRASVEEAMRVRDKAGKTEGYVLTVASQSGYNGEIRLALGVGINSIFLPSTLVTSAVADTISPILEGLRCEDSI
ncbi:MAG: hypothetical protein IKI63_05940 [Clostridia bacterium]|nr:hypothetical protein [Clostridia bacterium]